MAFPTRLLDDGEELLFDLRPHWRALVNPVLTVLVVLAGAIAAAVESVPTAAAWAAAVVLILVLARLVVRYARWRSTRLVLTTERLLQRRGVLRREGREVALPQLTDIGYRQSLLGRLIGEGDLLVEMAGRVGPEVFSSVPHPAEVQAEVARQANRCRYLRSYQPQPSIPEQIEKLDDLRRRGVISREEFEANKARLLGRL